MKIKSSIFPLLCITFLNSCKVTQTVNQTAVVSPQAGAVSVTQSAAISKPGTSLISSSAASTTTAGKVTVSSSTTVARNNHKTESVNVSSQTKIAIDPVGRWSGNDQGDFVAIHFGNAGDVKYTNPDGSVSGTWHLLRDGSIQITLRNAGASFVLTSSNSGTLLLGGKNISLTR